MGVGGAVGGGGGGGSLFDKTSAEAEAGGGEGPAAVAPWMLELAAKGGGPRRPKVRAPANTRESLDGEVFATELKTMLSHLKPGEGGKGAEAAGPPPPSSHISEAAALVSEDETIETVRRAARSNANPILHSRRGGWSAPSPPLSYACVAAKSAQIRSLRSENRSLQKRLEAQKEQSSYLLRQAIAENDAFREAMQRSGVAPPAAAQPPAEDSGAMVGVTGKGYSLLHDAAVAADAAPASAPAAAPSAHDGPEAAPAPPAGPTVQLLVSKAAEDDRYRLAFGSGLAPSRPPAADDDVPAGVRAPVNVHMVEQDGKFAVSIEEAEARTPLKYKVQIAPRPADGHQHDPARSTYSVKIVHDDTPPPPPPPGAEAGTGGGGDGLDERVQALAAKLSDAKQALAAAAPHAQRDEEQLQAELREVTAQARAPIPARPPLTATVPRP